jgi:hypothetical protein
MVPPGSSQWSQWMAAGFTTTERGDFLPFTIVSGTISLDYAANTTGVVNFQTFFSQLLVIVGGT